MIFNLGIRQRLEEREENLSPFAAKSRFSKGRLKPEEPCPMRTAFQQDRDRIIHCKAFRRLKHKTQVFIAPLGDHFITRLTHTLQVSQIARSISRALNLNEDLTEAIALAHDLGHTPFGHIGEEVLNELSPFGFRHNEQGLRVVDLLEREGQGLNLTFEVREGILLHSKPREGILTEIKGGTLEGQVVRIADSIAYINHDIADAIRAGIITERDLPKSAISILGYTSSQRIDTMVRDVVVSSWSATGLEKGKEPVITISQEVLKASEELREFLFEKVYNICGKSEEAKRARKIIAFLYNYFLHHPVELPPEYNLRQEELERKVLDYIAGMTDRFALRLAEEKGLR